MTEHARIGYYHGRQAARFRLNPSSFGYNPDFNFRTQAKRLFDNKDEIQDFLQAVEDYRNELQREQEEVS